MVRVYFNLFNRLSVSCWYQHRNLSVTNKSVRIILIDCLCSLLLRSRDSVELTTLLTDKSVSRQTIKLVRHLTFNVHVMLDTLIEHQFFFKVNNGFLFFILFCLKHIEKK